MGCLNHVHQKKLHGSNGWKQFPVKKLRSAVLFSGRSSVSANDGKWRHICATWENTAGSWQWYKDGKISASGKGLKTGAVPLSTANYGSLIWTELFIPQWVWNILVIASIYHYFLYFHRPRNPWRWSPGTRTGARFRRRNLWCQSKFHRWNGRCQHLGSRDKWPRNHAHVQVMPDRGGKRVSVERL